MWMIRGARESIRYHHCDSMTGFTELGYHTYILVFIESRTHAARHNTATQYIVVKL